MTITFQAANEVLDIQYKFNDVYSNELSGLLGNFDGDPDNDLWPQGASAPMSANSSSKDIYTDFGESCEFQIRA